MKVIRLLFLAILVAGAAAWAPSGPARAEAPRTFRDCTDCPEMVTIPAGKFVMGSAASEPGRFDNEGPRHLVTVQSFALGATEVTDAQFLEFLRETEYQPGPCEWPQGLSWHVPGRGLAYTPGSAESPRQPAVCLSWSDAQAYIAWLNHKAGGPPLYRLPSEAEWEYAARAGTTTSRWWGQGIGKNNADCNGCGSRWDNNFIAPVRSFGPNPFGLYDMLGDVWQWTADCWNESYVGAPTDGSAWTKGDCMRHVLRGGSWSNLPLFIRSAARSGGAAGDREYDYASYAGFRVAKTLPRPSLAERTPK